MLVVFVIVDVDIEVDHDTELGRDDNDGRDRPALDWARVRHQPRERGLRDDVGRELTGALPQPHARREGKAAHAVLRHRAREPRQLHRADQRPVSQPGDAG